MSRQVIRDMKRSVAAGGRPEAADAQRVLAREAALALLDRSIGFGHARLAVIRLAMAVHAGADVPSSHWSYCEEVARNCRDHSLKALLQSTAETLANRTGC